MSYPCRIHVSTSPSTRKQIPPINLIEIAVRTIIRIKFVVVVVWGGRGGGGGGGGGRGAATVGEGEQGTQTQKRKEERNCYWKVKHVFVKLLSGRLKVTRLTVTTDVASQSGGCCGPPRRFFRFHHLLLLLLLLLLPVIKSGARVSSEPWSNSFGHCWSFHFNRGELTGSSCSFFVVVAAAAAAVVVVVETQVDGDWWPMRRWQMQGGRESFSAEVMHSLPSLFPANWKMNFIEPNKASQQRHYSTFYHFALISYRRLEAMPTPALIHWRPCRPLDAPRFIGARFFFLFLPFSSFFFLFLPFSSFSSLKHSTRSVKWTLSRRRWQPSWRVSLNHFSFSWTVDADWSQHPFHLIDFIFFLF